jgi:two-component system, chemotaxis family, sensor kinase CheA
MHTTPHPRQTQPMAPPRKKKNRRTLRKRIMRNINMSAFLNIAFFCCIILVAIASVFRPLSQAASEKLGESIANELSSPIFLSYFKADSLEELDTTNEEAIGWIHKEVHKITDLGKIVWLADVQTIEEEERLIVKPVEEDSIFVRIELEGQTLFSNIPPNPVTVEGLPLKLLDYYTVEAATPLSDEAGKTIGSVTVSINPTIPVVLMIAFLFIVVVLFIAAIIINRIISLFFTASIIAPILQLEQRVKLLADEDFETLLDTNAKIVLKRPLREIESLMDSTNRIMGKMQQYAEQLQQQKATLEDQYDELEAQNDALNESKQRLQAAQQQLVQREKSVRNLLDNAKQGFLTFRSDLIVDDEYSLECARLFGGPIAGRSFPELMAGADDEQRIFIERLLQKLFQERDAAKRSVYLPLLPEETQFGNITVQTEYKMIQGTNNTDANDERCMVILTDITEKRHLQSRMEEERNTLQMVVKVVADYNDYTSLVTSFNDWVAAPFDETAVQSADTDDKLKDVLFDLFRTIHTFKGSFAQLGMARVAERLHEAESVISLIGKESPMRSAPEIIKLIGELHMEDWLAEEQAILRKILGDSFFDQEQALIVDRAKLVELERKMVQTLTPADCHALLPEIRKLRYKPFKELLRTAPDYVNGIAERLDRMIAPLEIVGGDFLVDGERYHSFIRSLSHVFRNAIDHGIEPPDKRLEAGKPEWGQLRCETRLEGDSILIEIKDDGGGVDTEKLKRQALARGVATEEQLLAMTEEDALRLVFLGEVSSKDEVTELSGRGVGLSAVLYETERLQGEVSVSSERGKGTTFLFKLPYDALNRLPDVGAKDWLQPLVSTAEQFFRESAGMDFLRHSGIRREQGERIGLKNVTSFIDVQGALTGMFIMTMNELAAETLVRRMAYGKLRLEEIRELMEDTVAEASNIIIGNSLGFNQLQEFINIETPITVFTEGASMKVVDSRVYSCNLIGEGMDVTLGFIEMSR